SELAFAGLPAASADLPIEGRAMFARGRCAAALSGLTNGELSSGIHVSNVGGQPSLACRSRTDTDHDGAGGEPAPAKKPGRPQGVRTIIRQGEERGTAARHGERDTHVGRGPS